MRILPLAVLTFGLVGCATTGGEGYAKVDCLAEADGSVSDCHIVSEDPAGIGFGAAAAEAVARGRVDVPGRPRRFHTVVKFKLAEEGQPVAAGSPN